MKTLKEILAERRKAQARQQQTITTGTETPEAPALILVPAFDLPSEDEFSQYF